MGQMVVVPRQAQRIHRVNSALVLQLDEGFLCCSQCLYCSLCLLRCMPRARKVTLWTPTKTTMIPGKVLEHLRVIGFAPAYFLTKQWWQTRITPVGVRFSAPNETSAAMSSPSYHCNYCMCLIGPYRTLDERNLFLWNMVLSVCAL